VSNLPAGGPGPGGRIQRRRSPRAWRRGAAMSSGSTLACRGAIRTGIGDHGAYHCTARARAGSASRHASSRRRSTHLTRLDWFVVIACLGQRSRRREFGNARARDERRITGSPCVVGPHDHRRLPSGPRPSCRARGPAPPVPLDLDLALALADPCQIEGGLRIEKGCHDRPRYQPRCSVARSVTRASLPPGPYPVPPASVSIGINSA
jgi:hypothetical protein